MAYIIENNFTEEGIDTGNSNYTMQKDRYVLEHWNNTYKNYNLEIPVHKYIEMQAQKLPDHPAVYFEDVVITYNELNLLANKLSYYLGARRVRSNQIVAVMMDRSFDMIITLLGILKCGDAYLPIDPNLPSDRIEYMLEASGANIIITHHNYYKLVSGFSGEVIRYDHERHFMNSCFPDENFNSLINNGESLAYVIFTSGSTGKPKGCKISHRALANRILWMQDAYPLSSSDRVLQKTPYSFDVSVWEFFWPLIAGASIVLAKPKGHKSPKYLVDLIILNKVTVCHFVPSMFSVFLNEPHCTLCESLRYVFTSGEALPYHSVEKFLDQFNCSLINLYGPTEAAIDVTFWKCEKRKDQKVFIGKPIHNICVYILEDNLQPVPIGEKGEIYIAGAGLANGYINNATLTNERFIDNPFDKHHFKKLYKTGDLGRFHSDGNIEYIGRLDSQVKLRGFRVELGEIESTLMEMQAIKEAIVLAKDLTCHSPRLVAYLTFKWNLTKMEIKNYLSTKLPDYCIPQFYVFMDAFPISSHGKLDKNALPWPATGKD